MSKLGCISPNTLLFAHDLQTGERLPFQKPKLGLVCPITKLIVNHPDNVSLLNSPAYSKQRKGGLKPLSSRYDWKPMLVPCGKCFQCTLSKKRDFALINELEAAWHILQGGSMFITLTYKPSTVPYTVGHPSGREQQTLSVRDLQLFKKRLRKYFSKHVSDSHKLKIYDAREYSPVKMRPHYHVIVHGFTFPESESEFHSKSKTGGHVLFTHPVLSKLWPQGLVNFAPDVSAAVAGYCAEYSVKDQSDPDHKLKFRKNPKGEIINYTNDKRFREKERLTRAKDSGRWYYELYKHQIFNSGCITMTPANGGTKHTYSIPRTFKRWYREEHPEEYFPYLERCEEFAISPMAMSLEETQRINAVRSSIAERTNREKLQRRQAIAARDGQ